MKNPYSVRYTVKRMLYGSLMSRLPADHPFARAPKEEGPRGGRPFIGFRIRPSALEKIDAIADEHDVSRSDVCRVALALALARKDEFARLLKTL